MARRKLSTLLSLIPLLLALVAVARLTNMLGVWRVRPPLFRQNNLREPTLSTRVMPDTASSHGVDGALAESHSDSAGNATAQHAKLSRRDLEKEFDRRHSLLVHSCAEYNARNATTTFNFQKPLRHTLPGPLKMYFVPKVGTSALWQFVGRVKARRPATPRSVSAVLVRHPLARLASAYRDKFLNGKPLSEYNDDWRRVTHSVQTWDERFLWYWLPALISGGILDRNRAFHKTFDKIRKAYQFYTNNYISQSGEVLALPTKEESQLYGRKEMVVAHSMFMLGCQVGFETAFRNSYNLSDLEIRFKSASFTFEQFLRHVVWTHDVGMPDQHWMAYTELCRPCQVKFDYVLKLETIEEEVQHLFCGVLGYPGQVSFPLKHRSYGHGLGISDRQYYANVSRDLMHRVLAIYQQDFTIFGYSQDL